MCCDLQGEIKHLFRNYAFLHSRMMLDNGGIFVCKCRHLVLAVAGAGGGGGGRRGGTGSGGLPGFMSHRLSSPAHPVEGGGGGRGGGLDSGGGSDRDRGGRGGGFRGRGRGRGGGMGRVREPIGQTTKITQGPYKGHIGMVKVC